MIKTLTCIECPMGCQIRVENINGEYFFSGNRCPRGSAYAKAETTCPKRVITSTVKSTNGQMIPVKTDKPAPKNQTFEIMKIINQTTCSPFVKLGDVLVENISEGVNLIVSGNL